MADTLKVTPVQLLAAQTQVVADIKLGRKTALNVLVAAKGEIGEKREVEVDGKQFIVVVDGRTAADSAVEPLAVKTRSAIKDSRPRKARKRSAGKIAR